MSDRTHFVYEAYDADGLLLYVGCTGKPRDRYRAHMSGWGGDAFRGWFGALATHWRVSGPYPKLTALALEKERTLRYQPIWNVRSDGNRPGNYGLIRDYLDFHGLRFEQNFGPGSDPVRTTRRLRAVS